MLRTRLSIASTTGSARAANTNHRCHFKNRSRRAAWAEMDYRFDVCRVTKGGHIQHLWGIPQKKNWEFLFSSVRRTLQSFPPLKCNDFMKRVRELWKLSRKQSSMAYTEQWWARLTQSVCKNYECAPSVSLGVQSGAESWTTSTLTSSCSYLWRLMGKHARALQRGGGVSRKTYFKLILRHQECKYSKTCLKRTLY
jgi:hypothetical protein